MVSVIIPVYNAEKYLKDCIYSIVNGTFSDYELILVDDGSTDGSGELCDELQLQVMSSPVFKNPPQEFHVLHQENGGVSKARNTAINTAKGEYIAFIDSDDTVKPEYLEKLYNTAVENEADFVLCDYEMKRPAKDNNTEDKEKKASEAETEVIPPDEYHERLHWIFGFIKYEVAWGKLFSKRLFGTIKFDENHINEDAAIIHCLVDAANRIVLFNEKLYCYYVREGSIMDGITQKTNKVINPEKFSDAMRAMAKRTEYYLKQKKYRLAFLAYNKFFAKLVDYGRLFFADRDNSEMKKYYEHYLSAAKTLYETVGKRYRISLKRKMYYKVYFLFPGAISFAAGKKHEKNAGYE